MFFLYILILNNSPVNRMRYHNRYLFIMTLHDGALCIDTKSGGTTVYFPGKAIYNVIIDKENNFWFATSNSRLYV